MELMMMSSSLRDRIAKVCSSELRRQQHDTDPHGVAAVYDTHTLADAIIKHLELVEDDGVIFGCTHD